MPQHKLKDYHVWGAPVYVLHPTLQQGKKIPRWQPRARRGLFLGFSPEHSSNVPLILNLKTGSILPQYHDLDDYVSQIHLDDDTPAILADEWLTPS